MRFRLVSTAEELETLLPAWAELWSRAARPEAMASPDWLSTWWKRYGSGRRLAVGIFYEADQLVGVAACCLRTFSYRPGLHFRRLEMLGAGDDESDAVCSEYLNLLAQRDREQAVADAFAEHLAAGAFGPWDEWVLEGASADDPMGACLKDAFARQRFALEIQETTQAPYLRLPGSWDELVASLKKKKRYTLRSAWKAFLEWSGGDYRLEHATDAESLRRGQDILHQLHADRWQSADRSGVFASARFREFHAEMIEAWQPRGLVDLCWLSVRGEPVAVHYSLRLGGKIYFYQCGRKVGVPGRVRVGIVMLRLVLTEAMAVGVREFDFLGGAARYKSLFTRTSRSIVTMRVARGWRETARKAARGLIDYWRGHG